jgi:tripartite ATP-independent transporter DctP family solute receptor
MPTSLTRRALVAGTAAASLSAPHIARAALRTLRLTQGSPPASPPGAGAIAFAQAVAADPVLGDVLKLDVHHNGELGDDMTSLTCCIDGTLDVVMIGTTVTSNIVPVIGVLDTPFLFASIAAARATLDGPARLDFAEALQARGISMLAWYENGVRHMTANKPIRNPADLVGLKLRVPPSEIIVGAFRALGANPGQVPFPAIYEALRTGTFEAEENPIGLIESSKLYEVQKVLSLTAHAYSAGLIVVSPDVLEDLTPPQQAALRRCAEAAQNATRAAADEAQRDGITRLQAKGMAVISDVNLPAFVAANQPYLAGMGQKFGAERMSKLMRSGAG